MIQAPIAAAIAERQARDREAILGALAQVRAGDEARVILESPLVRQFFIDRSLEFYEQFLRAPDAELAACRNRALDLNKFYDTFTAAVSAGRAARENLQAMEEARNESDQV